MFYLYFPGNSPLNRNELEEFSEMFNDNNFEFHSQEWNHWTDETKEFDLDLELQTIEKIINGKFELRIMGKSIGTYFASELIVKDDIKPDLLILMGIPSEIYSDNKETYLNAIKTSKKVVIVQNKKDPFGDIDQIKKDLLLPHVELIERDAEDHRYSVSGEVKKYL